MYEQMILGVNGSKSLGSLEAGVNGRLFMMPSAVTSNVVSISEVMTYSRVSPDRIRLMDLICLSQAPPMCEAVGVLNNHRTPFSLRSPSILSWFHSCNPWRSSRSAPTKFQPLSERMRSGSPRRAMKRCKQLRNESVSSDSATLMCTALELRQVNKHPYLFSRPRPLLTAMGPK